MSSRVAAACRISSSVGIAVFGLMFNVFLMPQLDDKFTGALTQACLIIGFMLMGATFVTEGALPFALRDPLRVSLACIAGSALAGFITILLGCGCPAPHGGLFLLPVMETPPGFLIALAVGTLTTALLLGMLKKPLKH